jgi:hypothetical protein
MKHLESYNQFSENNYRASVQLSKDTNYIVEYTFQDEFENRFLVQFKNITVGQNILGKLYTMSYFVWDSMINNWSVTKMAGTNPWRVVSTVLGVIVTDFLKRKSFLCNTLKFEGLAKENEKSFVTQRTKMYLRWLSMNPISNFSVINHGNNLITLKRINT